jgi:DNA-binding PadR family transcriptional regulator
MHQNRLSPAYIILGLLYHYPRHGYELHQKLCEEFGYIWHVSQSQTYTILKRLEQQGFITSTLVEQEKRPSRQLMYLTQKGSERFMCWLWSPTKPSVHSIRLEFFSQLYFIQKYFPERTMETIDAQIKQVNDELGRLRVGKTRISEDQLFNRLALEMRIKLLDSVIDWLTDIRHEIPHDHQAGIDRE